MYFDIAEAAYGYAMAGLLYGGLATAYIGTIALIIRTGFSR